jgi:hypothetical protein
MRIAMLLAAAAAAAELNRYHGLSSTVVNTRSMRKSPLFDISTSPNTAEVRPRSKTNAACLLNSV